MLVLSRKVGESIKIGNDITISVEKIKGQAVRIGIAAPKEMPVVRTELLSEQHANRQVEPQGKVGTPDVQ